MGKVIFIIAGLMIALLFADPSASQGMGAALKPTIRAATTGWELLYQVAIRSAQYYPTTSAPTVPEERSGIPSAWGLLLSWEGRNGIP